MHTGGPGRSPNTLLIIYIMEINDYVFVDLTSEVGTGQGMRKCVSVKDVHAGGCVCVHACVSVCA